MTVPDDPYDDTFEVDASGDSAEESPQFEGTNVCRVAAISMMFGGDEEAVRELDGELEQLGFHERLRAGTPEWSDVNLLVALSRLQERDAPFEAGRSWRWRLLGETARPEDAIGFLVDVLGSRLERESAAAAAALWRVTLPFSRREYWRGPRAWAVWDRMIDLFEPDWPEEGLWGFPWEAPGFPDTGSFDASDEVDWSPDRWYAIYSRTRSRFGERYADPLLVRLLCGWRLARALRSPDQITRSLATAAFLPEPGAEGGTGPPAPLRSAAPGPLVVSTMIHGTWGWKGNWWRPEAQNFHEFILHNHRPNLYSRGARFSWSGAYRTSHRAQAALDFCDWAYDVAANGLQSVFAHSYGGEVAARAVSCGARVAEIVLLSAPVTQPVTAVAASPIRVVDVRLQFDPVLALARARQRLQQSPNVTPVILRRWRYDHGATHREDVWRDEDVARRGVI
jgi:hypothetical protein